MSDDELVKRLRATMNWGGAAGIKPINQDGPEAADAIERLTRERDEARAERDRDCIALGLEIKALRKDAESAEAEVARLREALSPFVTITKTDGPAWYYENADDSVVVRCELTVGEIRKARDVMEAPHD